MERTEIETIANILTAGFALSFRFILRFSFVNRMKGFLWSDDILNGKANLREKKAVRW